MIWIGFSVLLVAVIAWLVLPLWTRAGDSPESDPELVEARQQLAILQADYAAGRIGPEMVTQAETALERRVLSVLNRPTPDSEASAARQSPFIWIIPAFMGLLSLGIYLQIGAPFYAGYTAAEEDQERFAAFERDVKALAAQIAENPDAPLGAYVLLARGYMGLEQYDTALGVYDQAIARAGDDSRVAEEAASARAYVDELRGLRSPAADAIRAMSETEQAEQINAMVEGLAVRLENDPLDPEGWQRLIRARLVLQQFEQAERDLQTARDLFVDLPDLSAQFEQSMAPLEAELQAQLAETP